MPEDFYRIKRLLLGYVFSEVTALKAEARAAGGATSSISGMGNPDGPTPPHIVAKLVEAVQEPEDPRLFGIARHYRATPRLRRVLRAPFWG